MEWRVVEGVDPGSRSPLKNNPPYRVHTFHTFHTLHYSRERKEDGRDNRWGLRSNGNKPSETG
jgi:hypothetical protein